MRVVAPNALKKMTFPNSTEPRYATTKTTSTRKKPSGSGAKPSVERDGSAWQGLEALKLCRLLLNYAVDEGCIGRNPASGVKARFLVWVSLTGSRWPTRSSNASMRSLSKSAAVCSSGSSGSNSVGVVKDPLPGRSSRRRDGQGPSAVHPIVRLDLLDDVSERSELALARGGMKIPRIAMRDWPTGNGKRGCCRRRPLFRRDT